MSTIGGPGGIGGPRGPNGPSGPSRPDGADDIAEIDASRDAGPVDAAHDAAHVDAAHAARAAGELEAMAADIAAGKLTAREAVERLVDTIAGADQLGPSERAELRELMTDLVANDPYLSSLVR